MGVLKLCTQVFSVSKYKIAPVSKMSNKPNNPYTILPSVRLSTVPKHLLGFQSGLATSSRGISSIALPSAKISGVSKNLLGYGFAKKLHNPLSDLIGRRHYSVYRNLDYICKPIVKCLSCVTFFTGRFETVPFTNQTLYVFPFIDKIWGEYYFRSVKEQFKQGMLLSQNHPDCVRVESIATKILKELQLETGRCHKLANRQWLEDDNGEVKLVKNSRRKEDDKSYLEEEIDWELFVMRVSVPGADAGYINIGKIIMFRDVFDSHKTDEELAAVIGNLVGHVVARHAQRTLIWFPFKLYHRVVHGYDPGVYYHLRHDQEADVIGMLLSAYAGYDPRVTPMTLEKKKPIFAKSAADLFLLDERIKYLSMPEVMEVALSIYQETKNGHGID